MKEKKYLFLHIKIVKIALFIILLNLLGFLNPLVFYVVNAMLMFLIFYLVVVIFQQNKTFNCLKKLVLKYKPSIKKFYNFHSNLTLKKHILTLRSSAIEQSFIEFQDPVKTQYRIMDTY